MPNIEPSYIQGNIQIYYGDNLVVLPELPDVSIDSIVTDCPYALQFMGKAWDKVLPAKETWIECLRVAKPGAIMLVFGGDRTHHRLMVDIEDSGWQIRTCIYWLYGSGFPKSLNISAAIDKMLGKEREVVGNRIRIGDKKAYPIHNQEYEGWGFSDIDKLGTVTAPATPEAQLWDGYGSSLKPAVEIIVLAMKPLDGTFAESALKHGVAGLNIDGGRIRTTEKLARPYNEANNKILGKYSRFGNTNEPQGRYPANLLLSHSPECREVGVKKVKGTAPIGPNAGKGSLLGSGKPGDWLTDGKRKGYNNKDGTETVPAYECAAGCPCGHVWSTEKLTPCPECGCRKVEWVCAVKMLDEQTKGTRAERGGKCGPNPGHGTGIAWNLPAKKGRCGYNDDNRGNASRFFYCAKASRTEREQGLKGHIPCVKCGGLDTDFHLDDKGDKVKCVRNNHPTVKSLAIMEYLCKLTMTPTGGVILDPFGGTGTTAMACEKVGRKCILIEKERKSYDIAVARLKGSTRQGRIF